jgi:hypothetical protein
LDLFGTFFREKSGNPALKAVADGHMREKTRSNFGVVTIARNPLAD